MESFVIKGGQPLSGTIRPSGNKNAALPIVAASLLSEEPVHLENVPRIRDVEAMIVRDRNRPSVILSKQYTPADTNWAYGTVGTVIGFWLKGK